MKIRLLTILAAGVLAFSSISCASDDTANSVEESVVTQDSTNVSGKLTVFEAFKEPTRTSLDYASGNFYWEAGDKIWVRDDNGVWNQSTNAVTGTKVDRFSFTVPGTYTSGSYLVVYHGDAKTANQVEIAATQTQTTPNTTTHFGKAGDNGIATATGNGANYRFTIDHQASYLVFQPFSSTDAQVRGAKLTKIEVTSDKNIAGTFTLDPATKKLVGTGSSKKINLITKGSSGTYANGFPMNVTAASLETNGAYMVIAPGLHKLSIRYWIKLADGTEGTVVQSLKAFNYEANHYYDIKRDFKINQALYYMWDAPLDYWNGVSKRPVTHLANNPNYPKASTPTRYYSNVIAHNNTETAASRSALFKTLPNANELTWYALGGDPHWDADRLWRTYDNKVYKGGVWIKRAAVIAADNGVTVQQMKERAYPIDATVWDLRKSRPKLFSAYTNTYDATRPLPGADEIADYFFLPALGFYMDGTFYFNNVTGIYWSSTAYPDAGRNSAYSFSASKGSITVNQSSRNYGIPAVPFQ